MAYTKTVWEDLPSEDTPIVSTALQNIEDGIEDLDTGKVNKTDIADNLTTNDATKVLSAKQGKVLNEKNNYSTTEVAIGMWGEDVLYRKIVTGTTASVSGWQDLTTINCDKIIGITGYILYGDRELFLPYAEPDFAMAVDFNTTNKKLRLYMQTTAFGNKPFEFLLEYIRNS